jgi:phosphatidylglycerol:prolipoprotein diacylglycerol transferase
MLALFREIFSPPRHLILLVIAAWAGLLLAEKRAGQRHVTREDINNLAFYGIIGFILGGRLSYILQNLSAFTKSPASIISINPDLFDPVGAIAVVLILFMIHVQRNQLNIWAILDAFVPFLASIAIGLGFSHLAAGIPFGLPTSVPWGVELWNDTRHPTQIYEILAAALTFGLLWYKKPHSRPGIDFLLFVTLTASAWLFISGFRADSTLILNGLHKEQVLAWVSLAAGFIAFEYRLKRTNPE